MDPENTRTCNSSSSDSTGSRSPPETPPAIPWTNGTTDSVTGITNQPTPGADLLTHPVHAIAHPQPQEKRGRAKTNSLMRGNKSHNSGAGGHNGGLVPMGNVLYHATGSHGMTYHLPNAHFSPVRPSGATPGIYSAHFPHNAYTGRPTVGYQMYPHKSDIVCTQFPTPHSVSSGTPPPPLPPQAPIVGAAASIQKIASVVPPMAPAPPAKISCYNCGSTNHIAIDCKDQTMEDITRKGNCKKFVFSEKIQSLLLIIS